MVFTLVCGCLYQPQAHWGCQAHKDNKLGHWYGQIRRDTEVQQQKGVISVYAQHSSTYYIRSNIQTALATCMSVPQACLGLKSYCSDGTRTKLRFCLHIFAHPDSRPGVSRKSLFVIVEPHSNFQKKSLEEKGGKHIKFSIQFARRKTGS